MRLSPRRRLPLGARLGLRPRLRTLRRPRPVVAPIVGALLHGPIRRTGGRLITPTAVARPAPIARPARDDRLPAGTPGLVGMPALAGAPPPAVVVAAVAA